MTSIFRCQAGVTRMEYALIVGLLAVAVLIVVSIVQAGLLEGLHQTGEVISNVNKAIPSKSP